MHPIESVSGCISLQSGIIFSVITNKVYILHSKFRRNSINVSLEFPGLDANTYSFSIDEGRPFQSRYLLL
jgi:hypothetical protein